jgi:FtsH-binding integral membrane protein
MNNYYGNSSWNTTAADGSSLSVSTVNSFLKQVMAIMAIGLGITGLVAYGVGQNMAADMDVFIASGNTYMPDGLLKTIFTTPLRWVVMFAPFVFILVINFGINRLSFMTASVLFALFAAVMGLTLSSIFVVFALGSIALTFFTTAGLFGVMAIIGITTKIDLTKFSSYFLMAIIGLVIVGLVNMFMQSETLGFIYGAAGVIIFTALVPFNMQTIVQTSGLVDHESEEGKKAGLLGALTLYMNFINLFLFLLRFMGSSRD